MALLAQHLESLHTESLEPAGVLSRESAIDTPSRAPTTRHRQTSRIHCPTAAGSPVAKPAQPTRGSASGPQVRHLGHAQPGRIEAGRDHRQPGRCPGDHTVARTRTAPGTAVRRARRATCTGAGHGVGGHQIGEPGQPAADAPDRSSAVCPARPGEPDRRPPGCAVGPGPAAASAARSWSSTRARQQPAARRPGPGPSQSRSPGRAPAAHRPDAAEARAARIDAAAAVRGQPVRFAGCRRNAVMAALAASTASLHRWRRSPADPIRSGQLVCAIAARYVPVGEALVATERRHAVRRPPAAAGRRVAPSAAVLLPPYRPVMASTNPRRYLRSGPASCDAADRGLVGTATLSQPGTADDQTSGRQLDNDIAVIKEKPYEWSRQHTCRHTCRRKWRRDCVG